MSLYFLLSVVINFICGGWALSIVIPYLNRRFGGYPTRIPFVLAGLIAVILGLFIPYVVTILCVAALILTITKRG